MSTRTCPTHNTTRRVSLNSQVREEGPVCVVLAAKVGRRLVPGNSGFPQHKNPHSSNRAGLEPRSSDIGAQFWRVLGQVVFVVFVGGDIPSAHEQRDVAFLFFSFGDLHLLYGSTWLAQQRPGGLAGFVLDPHDSCLQQHVCVPWCHHLCPCAFLSACWFALRPRVLVSHRSRTFVRGCLLLSTNYQ